LTNKPKDKDEKRVFGDAKKIHMFSLRRIWGRPEASQIRKGENGKTSQDGLKDIKGKKAGTRK